MSDVLSLSKYKDIVGLNSTEFDVQLIELVEAANRFVETFCGRVFGIAQYTERKQGVMDYQGRYVFHVKNLPLIGTPQSVTLQFFGADAPIALDVDRLDVFNDKGVVYYASALNPGLAVVRPEFQRNFYYDIVYSGGQAVPGDVTLAAAYIVQASQKWLASTTPTASGQSLGTVKKLTIGEYSEDYDNSFTDLHKDSGLVLTKTVKELLSRHKKLGQSIGP